MPAADREVVLELDSLVRHFPVYGSGVVRRQIGTVKAVDGVSMTIHRGETIGLVGESGCGKSTLARLVLALDQPTSGTVRISGVDPFTLSRKALRALRRRVQIVLQDPYTSLNPRMTVGDLVGEPFEIHPAATPPGGAAKAVRDLLDVVGLDPDHANRYPHQFSGGQRQRIGIARAIALRPELVVLDEPVSALDMSVQAQVINLLKDLQDEFQLSYLLIAHDLAVVRHVSDQVNVMYLGKIVERGESEEIHDRATHPYTQALLSAVAEPDPRESARRQRIILEGEVPSPIDPPSGCSFRTRCWKSAAVCASDVPALSVRPGSPHPCACHFASPRS
ncbi:MAG TPA: oligopeptide/dipeptide ABC transporter ATP-binding protein [Jatrophihabitantaceae bacterium]|nr:oligopeptide/dipeptide ABC transporter ATP-binding protein [Jatrophihabitantaceae bacterium]